jgi:hypothetical protein
MRTSVDRGTPAGQKPGWEQVRRTGSIIVGLVALCLIIAAIGCNEQFSKAGRLPEIVSFQANPPINKGDPAKYTFEVKNATKIVLTEAGNTIKEMSGIPATYIGAATGAASWALETSYSNAFDAVLEASNDGGTIRKTITLTPTAMLSAVMRNHPDYDLCAPLCPGIYSRCLTEQEAGYLGLSVKCSEVSCGVASDNVTPRYCYQGWCPPGGVCLTSDQASSQGLSVKCYERPCGYTSDNVTKYCYWLACPAGCTCMTPDEASSQGFNIRCSLNPCGVAADNSTYKYCYQTVCAPGCICMTPDQASMEGLSVKCSEESCGVTSDNVTTYCYKTACPCLPGCVCITADQASSQGYSVKCKEEPCGVTSDNVTKYCYENTYFLCAPGCICWTPDQASAHGLSMKCSEQPCRITSDNITKYCYVTGSCPYPCVCLTPDQASSQGFSMKCRELPCGVTSDNITKYCYEDPSPCSCRGWNPITVNWHGSAPETYPDLQCGTTVTIDEVTINTKITIISNPCSMGGCQPWPTYSYTITPPGSPAYQVNTSIPEFSFTPAMVGSYTVVLNATCGSTACPPCTITIIVNKVVTPPCSCIGWAPVLVHWLDYPSEGYRSVVCDSTLTIDEVTTNTPVVIGSNPCSLDGCQVPPTYGWTVTPPTGPIIQWDGLPAAFVPASTGSYTVVLNATCGDNPCPPCTITILIQGLVTPPCACQGFSSGGMVSWGGSSPGSDHGRCGGDPVVISSLTMGTPVELSEALAKCSDACQPPTTYSWTVTPPTGPTITSPPNSTDSFSFTPTSIGSYTVLIEASCGTTSCPPCTYTIIINELTRSLPAPAGKPIIETFTASAMQVASGEPAMLNWVITGEGNASLTCGGESQPVPFTGSMMVTPPQSGCCTLMASNKAGSDQKTVCITVVSPPVNDPVGGCCANGRISQATQSQCAQIGGEWYPSLTEATQACQPPTCWCCAGGRVYQATQAQCAQMGGACYNDQSQAVQACQQAPVSPRDTR